jgi:uncharacterized sulfatase
MDRRDFLKQTAASGVGLALAQSPALAKRADSNQPNILYIVVDEMRFPSVFPAGVKNAGAFLHRFMPHTHSLWLNGVKFAKHFSASVACTPSRGVLVTGLYNQQTWMVQTLKGTPDTKVSVPPVLDPVFPTYGKLLREAGYQTAYAGKWHLSLLKKNHTLEPYGFDGLLTPDPTGANLQGTVGDEANGYHSDADVAATAASWLSARTSGEQPWCLSVCFANPHDHEFFWAGTEFQTFNELFNNQSTYQPMTFYSSNKGIDYPPVVSWDANPLKSPPSYGYPSLPPNWESGDQLAANKPSTQTFIREFSAFVWGGVTDDPNQDQFTIAPFPGEEGYGTGLAPYSYWQRSLDSYTQVLSAVDQQIGRVLGALPPDVAANTVIVFTSDHGDYSGAHGLVSNKAGSGYDEAWHVPLIVVDPTGQFCGETDKIRHELSSSVDLMPLIVSIGNGGSLNWMQGAYKEMYGKRHDMLPMLKSASATGRDKVLMVSDEIVLSTYNFNDAPLHILGMRTKNEKLVTYSKWHTLTDVIVKKSMEVEFYDYLTAGGLAEIDNIPNDSRVPGLVHQLLGDELQNEIRAPLPGKYGFATSRAQARWLAFARLMEHPPKKDRLIALLKDWLGFGADT